ncbi:DoxX family protein [Herbiconiux sp. CPCC 205716]|uniref:DoxX family protein n=1 Tax=Herbiconiux gentiana TaxID=2970912 RepID=A0ABT2GFD4_9MICO|nr:DoxX family protein [Herbiconiux gentiana]MCS5713521.1 DoxX family protein [Herbiconiux gentiana]
MLAMLTDRNHRKRFAMLIAYWIVAGLLAVFYVYSGGIKAVRSKEALRPMMGWVDDMPFGVVRAIGVVEVVGAVGLIVPSLLGVAPWLAFAAAVGLVLVQVGAGVVHLRRGENVWMNGVLAVVAGVVVWLATVWF